MRRALGAVVVASAAAQTIAPPVQAIAPPPPSAQPATFQLTRVMADGSGYMADPQPIRTPDGAPGVQFISGTTKAIVRCPYPFQPQGCSSSPLRVTADDLAPEFRAAGVKVTNIQNVDLFQADDGGWHAAVTIGVSSDAHPQHWTVVAHARPLGPGDAGAPPHEWSADKVVSGSLRNPAAGNYDGKYYQEDGRLFLLLVVNTHPQPDLRNAIALQPMASFDRPAGPPTILLTTGDRYGELNSETFGDTKAKLVEAPWIIVVGGKHALVYSTGSYLTPGYKAAVAWSDTLLPLPGGRYRKVLEPDPAHIWGSAAGRDVRYLVQSARPRWPNFTGDSVVGPGVAAVTRGGGGGLWLIFNGFAPSDMPHRPGGQVDGTHRRPFAVQLMANVPPTTPVAGVSDEELATWLTPARR